MDEEPQAAVIADVATDPGAADGPTVLEEAVGRIDEIYVVVPIVERRRHVTLQVAKGGVFSYYEFPWPAERPPDRREVAPDAGRGHGARASCMDKLLQVAGWRVRRVADGCP